ncbi:leucine-rich repeat domain-containing protein [Faecalibacterium taiwanense]|uniref:leucine-rich repeat domain-containing protein n=1 Tax=Faecalibacterium taiwanense TaxID=3030638 RepID=UPI003AAD24DA
MKQRFSKRTRLVSALLTLAMVFTFLPFSAFAANTASTGIAFDSPDFKLNFPDAEFRSFLIDYCDTNNDGKLDVDIKSMTIPASYAIKSLEGIRFFEDLEKLDCHGIGLTTLNVGKNFKLKELDCSRNQLKESYPILSSGLKKLNCSNNKLTHMNLGILSGLNLEEVDCSNNNITNIVMWSVGELVKFDCSNNDLMTLDVSQCSKLQQLNCSGNQLMELNVNNQGQLTELDCHNNKLTELNVKQNGSLTSLICNDNQLTTLDLSQNHSLSNLNCANNRLACLNVTGIGGTITADGNRRPIAVRTDGTFDLTTLPGFDVSKATFLNGGSVFGTTLRVNAGADEVSYQYNCGDGVNRTFIFETSLPINEKNFPDDNFRNYIKTYKAGSRDVLTVEERSKVETIEVEGKNISRLEGIEAFPNLKVLKCGNNSIQKLDLRQNPKLETLKCNENQLTQLDLSKNPDIDYLYCSENQLEQLDVSHLQLKYLYCSHNDLEQLDVKNSKLLIELDCSKNNRLTALDLDVAHKPNLVRVECQNNQLTSLILGENKGLEKLNCANNQLTQLNLNNMSALKELNCANNQLTQLNLKNMISLKELRCQNNQLTALDVSSSPNLTTLVLKNNHLTSLNLDNNPNLNFTITDVYHSDFNNVYTVTLTPDRTFDLSALPGNFDKSRVTGWVSGTVKGNILTVNEGTKVVYYGYQCITGGIMDASFTLDVAGTGGSTGGGTVTPPEPPVTPPTGGGSTGGGDGGAGIAVLAIGGAAVAGLVGYGVYSYVSEQQLKALLPEGVAVPENRAQTALLLWNTAGRPEPAAQPAFPDVADPDTAKAAQWCVEQGLMNLKFRGRFAPDGSSPAYKTLNAYRQLVG